ncbi:secretin receptor isoform X3 [Rhinatrema bivittatum]|uniref:secretin receptor isoform X3 n=1 Tax=Rhinatrema bivittatum TaxID=194408 RepID=UPI00112A22B4|nr:secretin receptor isoform X3 [Rhinatrema bivittatum]
MATEPAALIASMWRRLLVILFLADTLLTESVSPGCDLLGVMKKEEDLCLEFLFQEQNRSENQWQTSGHCPGTWDSGICWPPSAVGQTVSAQCPKFLQILTGNQGFVYRNCTREGWSDTFQTVEVACGYEVNDTSNEARAGCKLVMILFQYCIMANYSWLLVEGLYLHTLLVVSFFSERKYFWWYIALGWGFPLVFIVAWSVCRHLYEDKGCWDINMNASIWWIIRGPVIMSIFLNFIFFVRILRILIKKLRTSEVWGNDFGHYKRLVKSTLLLIALFGVHYIVFAFFPEDVSSGTVEIRLSFELALGSFQGFVVAVLYCFLNGEVQFEIQRKWRPWHLRKLFWFQQHKNSTASSGGSVLTQLTKCSPKEQRRSSAQTSSIM